MVSPKLICGGVVFVLVGIPSIVMFACSFSTLDATQVGLDYSSISKSVSTEVYTSGLHFLGLGHSFIAYPTTLQSVDFSQEKGNLLKTRTSDGLPLTLGASFQYRYQAGTIYKLYEMFGGQEAIVFENTAAHLINVAATNYSAYQFFNDKQGIAGDLLKSMELYFGTELLVTVEALQLTQTQLPQSFEDAIQETINIQQNITQVQKQQRNVEVQLQTDIVVAQQNVLAKESLARGKASQILQAAQATARATIRTLQAQAASYYEIQQALGLTGNNTTKLLEYVYWDALGTAGSSSAAQFLVGVKPETFIQGSS